MIYFDFMHGKNNLSAWAQFQLSLVSYKKADFYGLTSHLKKQTGTPFEIDPFPNIRF